MSSSLAAYLQKPTATFFVTQEQGEEIILLLRRHPITNLPWILTVFLMLVLPFFFIPALADGAASFLPNLPFRALLPLTLLWYIFTLGFALESFLNWYFTVLILTDQRIVDIDLVGFLFKSVAEAPLTQVQDVTHEVGGFAKIFFDYGNLFIQTAAEVERIEFLGIPHPAEVHKIVTQTVHQIQRGVGH